jgi:hypothetical protein
VEVRVSLSQIKVGKCSLYSPDRIHNGKMTLKRSKIVIKIKERVHITLLFVNEKSPAIYRTVKHVSLENVHLMIRMNPKGHTTQMTRRVRKENIK